MKYVYKRMPHAELLTRIYNDAQFRHDYFKWLRIGGYSPGKQRVNAVVINYENFVLDKLENAWFAKIRFENIDLVDYKGHKKQIKAFVAQQ